MIVQIFGHLLQIMVELLSRWMWPQDMMISLQKCSWSWKKCRENRSQYIFSLLPFWTFSSGFSASIIMRWVNARAWQWINYFFPTLASKERRRETKRAFSILFWLHNSLAGNLKMGLKSIELSSILHTKWCSAVLFSIFPTSLLWDFFFCVTFFG